MYADKKIIGITGAPASGKTSLLNFLQNKANVTTLKLDEAVEVLMPRKKRLKIYKKRGIEYLENILYPKLEKLVHEYITEAKHDTVVIEGVDFEFFLKDIVDIVLELNVPYGLRKIRSMKKGCTYNKFEEYNNLYFNRRAKRRRIGNAGKK